MVWTNADSGTEIDTTGWSGTVTTNSIVPPTIGDEHCKVSDPTNPPPESSVLASGDLFTVTHTEQYTRTADTVWRVQTGGKAIPGRNSLWQFNGSAWEILDKRATPSFYGATMNEITNKTQIAIGSFGNLKADGTLWLALPDGADKDITPTLAGKDFYTFSVGGQKYTLTLTANGIDLSTNTPTYCVGQKISFSPVWIPSTPPYINALSTARWHFQGNYVNEKPYSWCSGYYDENDDLLFGESVFCWYVDALQAGIASIGMNLQFANGQSVSIPALGKLNVYRPTIVSSAQTPGEMAVYPYGAGTRVIGAVP